MRSLAKWVGAIALLLCAAPSAQCATITKIFDSKLTLQSGSDTLGLNGQLVKFEVTFNDGTPTTGFGTIAGVNVYLHPNYQLKSVIAPAFSNWAISNGGAVDTLSLLVNEAGGEFLQINGLSGGNVVSALSSDTTKVTPLTDSLVFPLGSVFYGAADGSQYSGAVTGVPEPASMAVLGLVVAAGSGMQLRRRFAKKAA